MALTTIPILRQTRPRTRGFTVVELLVIVGIIATLMGLLLVGLSGVRRSGFMVQSMNNMRQIGTWMRNYSSENRDFILPSEFNYSANPSPGKVRSIAPSTGGLNRGSWADILWTTQDELRIATETNAASPVPLDPYRYDSPDDVLYDAFGDGAFRNPLRSTAPNSRDFQNGDGTARPHGRGAFSLGNPGYFAANNFFNANPAEGGQFYTNGQIKLPERSVYLVDSVAGETIEPAEAPWDSSGLIGAGAVDVTMTDLEVDFRYNNNCLMLFLDMHVGPVNAWGTLCDLEVDKQIRVRDLTARMPPCP